MTAIAGTRAGTFHRLRVSSVSVASADGSALAIDLHIPDDLRQAYAFTAGQHVTLRFTGPAGPLRRTYSICSTPDELTRHGVLRLGVRRIPGGAFAEFSTGMLAGVELDVLTPSGSFGTSPDSGRRRSYAGIAAGSGVTPLLSVVSDTLSVERHSTFKLLYANRTVASTMFVDELAQVKDRFLHRFELYHLISREPRREGLNTGRLDPPTLRELLPAVLDPAAIDEWFVCGSQQLCRAVIPVLGELGGAGDIHTELFFADTAGQVRSAAPVAVDSVSAGCGSLTTILNGRRVNRPLRPGGSVLDSALDGEPDLPYSCTTGVCGTCRARVVEGEVDPGSPWALTPQELAAAQILTCQAKPLSDVLTVDFDLP